MSSGEQQRVGGIAGPEQTAAVPHRAERQRPAGMNRAEKAQEIAPHAGTVHEREAQNDRFQIGCGRMNHPFSREFAATVRIFRRARMRFSPGRSGRRFLPHRLDAGGENQAPHSAGARLLNQRPRRFDVGPLQFIRRNRRCGVRARCEVDDGANSLKRAPPIGFGA